MPMPATFELDGKLALVSGASRGIGEAGARLLAAHGAHVIVSSRRIEACEAVAQSIREAGGSAEALACHIGDPDSIEAAFAAIDARHGRLDVLVNNAAANPYFGPIVDTGIDAFQKTVDVNIRGYFLMSQAAAKRMAKCGSGSIINVASVNGVIPGDYQGIYSITKAAILSMTKAFAKECAAQGVRVNALLPGLTDTKFAGPLIHDPAILAHALGRIPLGRVADPAEMAGALLFLASPASSYVTGTWLNVDGGYLAA